MYIQHIISESIFRYWVQTLIINRINKLQVPIYLESNGFNYIAAKFSKEMLENVKVIQGAEGSAIHFHRPSVGSVSYVWSKRGDNANRIIRRNR